MKTDKTILDLNEKSESANGDNAGAPSIEDIIARGADAAIATEPETAPDDGLVITEPRKRRAYKRRGKQPEATPEEQAQQQAAKELEAFFSPEGIGAVFTNGLTAFYMSCGANPLTPEEQPMLATVFAQWARYRLPAGASSYQPDILLAAALMMTTLPRMQPIATTTAPFWRRFFGKLAAPFRRKRV